MLFLEAKYYYMKTVFLFILLFAINSLFSQSVISPAMNAVLNENSQKEDYVDINIYFNSSKDITVLAAELDAKKASFDERVKAVTVLLKENSKISQNDFASVIDELLRMDSESVGEVQYFWGVNMLNLKVKKQYIYIISEIEGIRYIDLNFPRYRISEVTETVNSDIRTVGGAEPGLKTINAHKLWALGYSGRNILFLSMDTGVFPDHPAISDNFAGNHFPMSQCWYGVRSNEPADNSSASHGTHTTGTTLGLDAATNDTIGVAFNAMWIASDPVASTNDELLTPDDFMAVFQWVLDPDGNPETTDDVPRVINNSWGYDYTLALQFGACEMAEADVFIALETAGICSPFSAGNEGPGPATNGFPAMRAFNLVNPMSIGAVNASNIIASFSSRGPTPCIDIEGSLQIKPEVVAPGVNIRSCSGVNSYSFLQGTSMSCPHVSGSLLLLAEAFPMASAYELKYALYTTAVDLGDAGEDNVYGNGLIDVFAAYNYLALTYTPAPPVTNKYDLTASLQSPISNFLCPDQNSQEVKVLVKNDGELAIDTFKISIYVNEILVCDSLIEIILESGEEFLFTTPQQQQLIPGVNYIHTLVVPFHAYTEYNRFNNAVNQKIYVLHQTEFPYDENFEAANIDLTDSDLFIINPDNKSTWKNLTWGADDQHKALGINFRDYGSRLWEQDFASLPQIHLPNEDSLSLVFTYAYKNRLAHYYNDSLIVELSVDCGLNFNEILYRDGGYTMATVDGEAISAKYKPIDAAEFDTVIIMLDDYRNQDIVLRFRSMNDRGSLIYIDNVQILKLSVNSIENNIIESKFPVIFPNPVNEYMDIECFYDNELVQICDVSGKIVLQTNILKGINRICTSQISKGLYIVKFINSGHTKKVIIVR